MLETGPIGRFQKVGNYASYCRKVSSRWISNDKIKVAAIKRTATSIWHGRFPKRPSLPGAIDPQSRNYYNRKMKKTNFMVAHNALAHKLARAAYYVIKDQVPFMPEKMFAT